MRKCYCHLRKHASGVCSCYCPDCGQQANQIAMFMVREDLWTEITNAEPPIDTRQVLCMSCAEKRLGRGIQEGDLTQAPVNSKWRRA